MRDTKFKNRIREKNKTILIQFNSILTKRRFLVINPLVPAHGHTLRSHRTTGGALPSLNKDCESHRGCGIKRYKSDYRASVLTFDVTKNLSVKCNC